MNNLSKTCTKCHIEKPLDQFLIDRRRANNRGSHCYKCNATYLRVRYNSNKDVSRAYKLKINFNITLENYREMLVTQDNKCFICKKEEITVDNRTGIVKKLAVDHCHKTKKVRGLLCTNCNTGIGKFKDNCATMEAAVAYLRKFQ